VQTLRNIKHRVADERGTALVEFAFVLPVLALVLFGFIDFGRILNYNNDLNQMAADGARFAAVNRIPPAVHSCSVSTLKGRIACQADTTELRPPGQGAVTVPATVAILTDGTAGDAVKVCVKADYRPFSILGLGATIHLHGEATMRLEQPPTNYTPDGNDATADCPS
jgi:Flp pilus assembly protein TadG